jgi:hypothetical protein
MDIILGAVAAVCMYFAWKYTRYFWRKYKIDERLINDKVDSQLFVGALLFIVMSIILVMEIVT